MPDVILSLHRFTGSPLDSIGILVQVSSQDHPIDSHEKKYVTLEEHRGGGKGGGKDPSITHIGNHAVCSAKSADGFLVQIQVVNTLRNCHGSRSKPLYNNG
jgi:hypothetical protein